MIYIINTKTDYKPCPSTYKPSLPLSIKNFIQEELQLFVEELQRYITHVFLEERAKKNESFLV